VTGGNRGLGRRDEREVNAGAAACVITQPSSTKVKSRDTKREKRMKKFRPEGKEGKKNPRLFCHRQHTSHSSDAHGMGRLLQHG